MQSYIKKGDFLRPVYKKVKTVTIFMGKMRSCDTPHFEKM